ncbi:hypothetical protein Kpol_1059p9 [Vanderwaltozyma polyspora DSM 70294]|uniref:Uncharacterized protein n=1 Tax=Vanderwaltozyma polyspora (strain ATCC 22028 / DSM 70294 / BCRC 21397 / CBS 2163 / NBRC 10782 / NRRL Y-8283 / UCD 57-17) TaxID=436907 RepID=A7TN13_VANPO|nr:uncharacterized protein Kpol_1059p9 [Vanderwaltozyma polyspora DSM 70294]EDO16319.1 hypothetical protein Kpol_1059p9 [Vanderwaltozyma polyspora DSM 70294]
MPIRRLDRDDLKELSLVEPDKSIITRNAINGRFSIYNEGPDISAYPANIHEGNEVNRSAVMGQFSDNIFASKPRLRIQDNEDTKYGGIFNGEEDRENGFKRQIRNNRSLKISPMKKAISLGYSSKICKQEGHMVEKSDSRQISNNSRVRFHEDVEIQSTPLTKYINRPMLNILSNASNGSNNKKKNPRTRIFELKREIDQNIQILEDYNKVISYNIGHKKRDISLPEESSTRTIKIQNDILRNDFNSNNYNKNNRRPSSINMKSNHVYMTNENSYLGNESLTSAGTIHSISPSIFSQLDRSSIDESMVINTQNKMYPNMQTPTNEQDEVVTKKQIDWNLGSNMIEKFCVEDNMWKTSVGHWMIENSKDDSDNCMQVTSSQETSRPYLYEIQTMILNSLNN